MSDVTPAIPELRPTGEGQFEISGPVMFSTVTTLYAGSAGLFDGAGDLTIDLAPVTSADSAALALFLEWLRQAARSGRKLRYTGISGKLHAIAELGDVEDILAGKVQGA